MTPLPDYRVADSPCSLIITPLVASFGYGDNGGWELKYDYYEQNKVAEDWYRTGHHVNSCSGTGAAAEF